MAYFGMTAPAVELWPDAMLVFDIMELTLGAAQLDSSTAQEACRTVQS